MEKFLAMLSFIVPPDAGLSTDIGRWRLSVALAIVAFCAHIAWACGYFPMVSGFALDKDLQRQVEVSRNLTEGQDKILIRLIAGDIENARKEQCRSLANNNKAAAEGWAITMVNALTEYRQLANRDYVLRSCNEY